LQINIETVAYFYYNSSLATLIVGTILMKFSTCQLNDRHLPLTWMTDRQTVRQTER